MAPSALWAALAATTVWEIQAEATANSVNGCGFNPSNASVGTDRSQSTEAFANGTDLASVDGDAVPCVVTSASHNFVAADNGNLIHITAGTEWTAGWYEIVSTSGNAATLDRACGTDGAKTSGTWYLGGACNMSNHSSAALMPAALVPENKVYIKKGSYSPGSNAITFTAGTASAPIYLFGYDTSRTATPVGANRPTITIAASFTFSYGDVRNVILAASGQNLYLYNGYVENCKITGNYVGNGGRAFNSEFTSPGAYAITGAALVYGCYIHDSSVGIYYTLQIINNVIANCGTAGVLALTDGTTVIGNTFYGADDADAIAINLVAFNAGNIYGNIIANWFKGINTTGKMVVEDYNLFYGNNSNGVTLGLHSVEANPAFANIAGGDFRVGTAAKAGGSPASFPGISSPGYPDFGAVQRAEPTASSGGAWGF